MGPQASKISASVWLSDWSEDDDTLQVNQSRLKTDLRLGVYGMFGFFQGSDLEDVNDLHYTDCQIFVCFL